MKLSRKINIAKKLSFIVFLTATCTLFAQEKETPLSISASIDTYFRTNLSGPVGEDAIAPGSSFANLNGFSLGMANLIVSYEGESVGFVADLVFGPRGTDAIFASPMYSTTGNMVNQLYGYWNINDRIKLTMGNFNTFLGYEVISAAGNFNYSTSYLFSYGPFSHAGLKADFKIGNEITAMIGVFNPTDLTEFNPTANYAFGAQLGFKGQYLNYLSDATAYEIDYTGGYQFSDLFYLGINASTFKSGEVGFNGIALYPQIAASDTFSIGLRGEYFVEKGDFGAIGSGVEDSSVFALTLTGSVNIGKMIIKPEFRIDASSDPVFLDSSLSGSKNLSSFLIAAIVAL